MHFGYLGGFSSFFSLLKSVRAQCEHSNKTVIIIWKSVSPEQIPVKSFVQYLGLEPQIKGIW